MKILIIGKFPPIQGGVSCETFWTATGLAELGHDVSVVTNADEVEESARISLSPDDQKWFDDHCTDKGIQVLRTYKDRQHVYIPSGNPVVSKLATLALDHIHRNRPDVIYAHYLEPYGIVSMLVSLYAGLPFVVRHAGSDLFRLMPTDQLRSLYQACLKSATIVLSKKGNWPDLVEIGVEEARLREPSSLRLRPDVFYMDSRLPPEGAVRLGIYGKTGEAKGTSELIDGMAQLRLRGVDVTLEALWGGRHVVEACDRIARLDLEDVIRVHGFLPPWRIGDFIRDCHAILFLENRFRVRSHSPGVPLEVSACGRPIIITEEIANKRPYDELFEDGRNAVVVRGALTAEKIAEAVEAMMRSSRIRASYTEKMVDPQVLFCRAVKQAEASLMAACGS